MKWITLISSSLALFLGACSTPPATISVPAVRTGPVTEKIKFIKADTTTLTNQLRSLETSLAEKTSTIQGKDELIHSAGLKVRESLAVAEGLQTKVASLEESNTQLNSDVQVLTNVATNNKKAADEEHKKNADLELKLARTQRSLYQRDLIVGVLGVGILGFTAFKLRSLIPF